MRNLVSFKLALILYFVTRISLRLVMGKHKRNAFLNIHKIRVSTFFPGTQLITKNNITAYVRRNSDDYELLFFPREVAVNHNLKLKDHETFVDIGANVGYYSLKLKKESPSSRIIAIEAHPDTYKALCKNVAVNDVDIECINCVAYNKRESIMLYEQGGWSGISSIYRKTNRGVRVQADTLDNIVSEHKIQKVDVIKIDVEGAEVEVLLGAKKALATCRLIIVEIHGENLEPVKQILQNSDFTIEVLNNGEFVMGKK